MDIPIDLVHDWRVAQMEAMESGRPLLLHLEGKDHGGEILPLLDALEHWSGFGDGTHPTVLTTGGSPVVWLLANQAMVEAKDHATAPRTRPGPQGIVWTGATRGMEDCQFNLAVSQPVVNGLVVADGREPNHIQRALAPGMTLDRTVLFRNLALPTRDRMEVGPGIWELRSRWDERHARPAPLTSWLGFWTAVVLFLVGITRFVLNLF